MATHNGGAPGDGLAVIVLAAGQGTRLRSRLPKPLHVIGGRSLIGHVLHAVATLSPRQTVIVTGHGAADVRQHLQLGQPPADRTTGLGDLGDLVEAFQAEQLGTAHAVQVGLAAVDPALTTVVTLYADTPLITGATLQALVATRNAAAARLAVTTAVTAQPTGYGRIVRDAEGRLLASIEEREATPLQRTITEINTGFYAFDAEWLRATLPRVERSPGGEYYLPDLLHLAVAEASPNGPWPVTTLAADIEEAMGINDRLQLAEAGRLMRERVNRRLMLAGVTLLDPPSTMIDDTVTIGPDTVIHPFSIIRGATSIGSDCTIGPHAVIENATIADRCRVVASFLHECRMESDSDVGPFSRLRPGAHLGQHVHVGNFGEIKNAELGEHTAVGHFSYIGDATIGERVNIGAGTITANFGYRSHTKERTVIGNDAYIGSDTVFVPPVQIGEGAATGAGAIVNRDVAAGSLVVGVPARPIEERRRSGAAEASTAEAPPVPTDPA